MVEVAQVFQSFMHAHGLHPGQQNILAAVSGGPDSMALLHLLWQWDPQHIQVFHLNHEFRSEAAAEQQFVEAAAAAWDLPMHSYARDVNAYAADNGLGKQTAARVVRLQLLEECAAAHGCAYMALAHHQDDQIETIMMRILRGTGLTGLKGIAPLRGQMLRPLLQVSKAELLRYCQHRKIAYCQDLSNASDYYFRNRVRNKILPLLEAEAPGFGKRLLQLQQLATEDDTYLETEAEEQFLRLGEATASGWGIQREAWAALPIALQRRVLRQLLRKVLGSSRKVSYQHIEVLRQKALQLGAFSLDIPSMVVIGTANTIQAYLRQPLHKEPSSVAILPRIPSGGHDLAIPGTCQGSWGTVSVQKCQLRTADLAAAIDAVRNEPWQEVFDKSGLELPLRVRSWQPGDELLGLDGHSKKVNRIFIDAKIPKVRRELWPIVCDQTRILWIPGLKRSGHGLISPQTETVIRLTFTPKPDCHDPIAVL